MNSRASARPLLPDCHAWAIDQQVLAHALSMTHSPAWTPSQHINKANRCGPVPSVIPEDTRQGLAGKRDDTSGAKDVSQRVTLFPGKVTAVAIDPDNPVKHTRKT